MYLKPYLKKAKLTMAEFAKMCQSSQPFISQIANGHNRPSPDLALRIEQAAGGEVTRMELLYPAEVV